MSASPHRSPADALVGEGTGAGLRHPQETRGSDAPSPACARSRRRWAAPLQRGFPVPLEKQVSLLLLRLLHPPPAPSGGCPSNPPPVPAPGLPSAGRESPASSGSAAGATPPPKLPQPRTGASDRSPPAARLGRAGSRYPARSGSGGSAESGGKRCPAAILTAVGAAPFNSFPAPPARAGGRLGALLGSGRGPGGSPRPDTA